MKLQEPLSFQNVNITGGFWADKQKTNRDVTIYAVRDRFRETGRFDAFACNWTVDSTIPKPHYFWDSDVAKWMEAVCYIISKSPDVRLLSEVDGLIDLIEKNQGEDGYFNIYHTVVEPENRFRYRSHHELYCLGHLIEAAVAYYNATGNGRFIDILDRYIDLVIKTFMQEGSADFHTPGHEEIELALFKLYRVRKDPKYAELAMFFINERGKHNEESARPDLFYPIQSQSDLPVRVRKTAEGHAVRACYLYSAMADAAAELQDEELKEVCDSIFRDITRRKMYITGGIGSTYKGESFTAQFDLPNDTAYNETCAAIGLAFFAERMKRLELNSEFADLTEREMYNGILSGLSLDGTSFFYENPLEINLKDRSRHKSAKKGDRLPIVSRQKIFDVSCCPPNLARFIASIGNTVFSQDQDTVYVHQFMESEAQFDGVQIKMETKYPENGKIYLHASGLNGKKLGIRIPGWCEEYHFSGSYSTSCGYALFTPAGDELALDIDFVMKPHFIYADPSVRADAGKMALSYGPVIYCLEGEDNAFDLHNVIIDRSIEPQIVFNETFGMNTIRCTGKILDATENLYNIAGTEHYSDVEVKLIPYYVFANRGESDMQVWFRA